MAKKKNKRKQTIRIFFRDGKKDVIPQKLWDDYERGLYFMTPQFVVVAEKMIRTDFDPPAGLADVAKKKK